MPSLTITLKQQTPLIHFQVEETGATLRATELKPKLDRFLWAVEKDNIFPDWKISKDVDALAYKVRIDPLPGGSTVVGDTDIAKNLKNTLYFNPSGEDAAEQNKVKHGYVLSNSEFDITFMSQHAELLNKIKKHIYAFFILHNFGFRSSKGFGSYIVTKLDGKQVTQKNYADDLLSMPEFENVAYSMALTGQNCGWLGVCQQIKDFYMPLKDYYLSEQYITGANNPGHEKEFMQSHFSNVQKFYQSVADHFKGAWNAPQKRSNPPGYRFYRALLGLADHYEFYAKDVKAKAAVKVTDPRSESENNSEKEQAIVRFESPVFFKPYCDGRQWIVLIFLKTIPDEMFDAAFSLSDSVKSEEIKSPKKKEFDLKKFFADYQRKTSGNTAGRIHNDKPNKLPYYKTFNNKYAEYTQIYEVALQSRKGGQC